MKTVRMHTTAANPDRILHAGQTYRLPDEVADQLLAGRAVHGTNAEGKPILGGPCATEVPRHESRKAISPTAPDPEEKASATEIEGDEDEDEDEDEE